VPGPFLSYLRVYEPLRAFDGPAGEAVRAGLARGAVRPDRVGRREREVCLRATVHGRLLPAAAPVDVLVLGGESGEPFVCPLDTRPRAAAAVLGFLAEEEAPVLRSVVFGVSERSARRRAERAVTELGEGAAHVVSAGWTVPLPWFALVDPEERQVGTGAQRRVWWRVPIAKALSRASRAERLLRENFGDGGPAEVLEETRGWLDRFDGASIVELDYGGLVDLLDEAAIRDDRSAALVQKGLRALREGDSEAAAECYAELREFWGEVAGRQRDG
jgi:hypothetical protein